MIRSTIFKMLTTFILFLFVVVQASVSEIPQADRDNFLDSLNAAGLTLVEFYSPNCRHCRHYSDTLKKVCQYIESHESMSQVRIEQFNCKGGRWCKTLDIKSIPLLRLYNRSELISELVGAKDYATVIKWLKQAMKQAYKDNAELLERLRTSNSIAGNNNDNDQDRHYGERTTDALLVPPTTVDDSSNSANNAMDQVNNPLLITTDPPFSVPPVKAY